MNRQALELTLYTGKIHTYSRSRGRLALKGESSAISSTSAVLDRLRPRRRPLKVEQDVAACHEGYRSCFYRSNEDGKWKAIGEKAFDPDAVYKSSRR